MALHVGGVPSMALICGSCRALLAAPAGSPVVRCGHCGMVLRLGRTMQAIPPPAQVLIERLRQMQSNAAYSGGTKKDTTTSKDALDSLHKFKADKAFAAQGVTCPITADAIKHGDTVVQLPCGHMFSDEVLEWLRLNHTCPVCRHELETTSQAKQRAAAGRAYPGAGSSAPSPAPAASSAAGPSGGSSATSAETSSGGSGGPRAGSVRVGHLAHGGSGGGASGGSSSGGYARMETEGGSKSDAKTCVIS